MNNFRVYNIDHYNYLLHQISNFPTVQSNELNLMLATFPRPVPSRLSLNWPLVKSGSRREELIPVVNFSVTYVTWGAHGFPPFPSSSIHFPLTKVWFHPVPSISIGRFTLAPLEAGPRRHISKGHAGVLVEPLVVDWKPRSPARNWHIAGPKMVECPHKPY